jgi:hypothetical protein
MQGLNESRFLAENSFVVKVELTQQLGCYLREYGFLRALVLNRGVLRLLVHAAIEKGFSEPPKILAANPTFLDSMWSRMSRQAYIMPATDSYHTSSSKEGDFVANVRTYNHVRVRKFSEHLAVTEIIYFFLKGLVFITAFGWSD